MDAKSIRDPTISWRLGLYVPRPECFCRATTATITNTNIQLPVISTNTHTTVTITKTNIQLPVISNNTHTHTTATITNTNIQLPVININTHTF